MSAIFPYGTWIDITSRGTSGDQVSDILASWKADAWKMMTEAEARDTTIRNQEATIDALRKILSRVREVGDHLAIVADNEDSTKYSKIMAIHAWNYVSNKELPK